MDDPQPDKPDLPVPNLRAAMRVARIEEAERSEAVANLRGAELARLEMLRDAVAPVLAQVPDEADMFDCGLVPGPHPRLFIDMVAYVEMAHDRRHYRLVQATRHGRTVLAESERIDAMVQAVTAYVARRLVAGEKALPAAEATVPARASQPVRAVAPRRRRGAWIGAVAAVLLQYLGLASLGMLLLALLRHGSGSWPHLLQ